ncbi:MAG TPA: hypothetical protein VE153_34370 [Myxococcus sp.]|nr:hypothetical protein [Myxococcus sp.]
MRLGRAGCERELFASDAVAMLHEGARGALREAARRKKKLVERDAVSRMLDTAAPAES